MNEFRKIFKCRGCNAEIIWIKTASGKSMPIDAKPIKAYSRILAVEVYSDTGLKYILTDVHMPHWSTCPGAEQFRKSKK